MKFLEFTASIDGFAQVVLDVGDGRRTRVTIQLPQTPLTKEDFERLVKEQLKLVRELRSRLGYLGSLVQYQALDIEDEEAGHATT